MDLEKIQSLLDGTPDFPTFLTYEELHASSMDLCKNNPGVVECIKIGDSALGRPIEMLKIGNGSKKALLIGMIHPMEPIGSMMSEYLAARLVEDKDFRESFDTTWYIIKCIDPDGMVLNEGWLKGPYTLTNYMRYYYSPPHYKQTAWSFPIKYKTLIFDKPTVEARHLMRVLEEIKPDFIYSLHNAALGGCYLYLAKDTPAFYPLFYKLVEDEGIPLHLGEAEMPYIPMYSKAIFGKSSIDANYDFIEKNNPGVDPASKIFHGSSDYEYANQFCDPDYLICELPYFLVPQIADTTPSTVSRRKVVIENYQAYIDLLDFIESEYEKTKRFVLKNSPFKDSVEYQLKYLKAGIASRKVWAETEIDQAEKATNAEYFDNIFAKRIYMMSGLTQYIRMLEDVLLSDDLNPEVKDSHERAVDYFNKWMDRLEKGIEYSVIPIRKLVRIQLGCALYLLSVGNN